ncbi:hypothetical protein [Aequorivita xiaoshiensis]|uniref:Uncharacterized protein n=1 Tax=Aequorivita xiaoshiensis TaxID=2874476 RepID=A0A9X1R114_9FLAO|nr:hypothetical protein [Aequorivita xiaoshiensis]MCG2430301.1 hypothetical protein [Aequorivita xiaoshiensis]
MTRKESKINISVEEQYFSSEFSEKENKEIKPDEIGKNIPILEYLNNNIYEIFEFSKEQRTALIKASGQLSRPNRDEFSRRKKDFKKAQKRKPAERKIELQDFQLPLDILDAVARVMDSLFDEVNTRNLWSGKFLKNY